MVACVAQPELSVVVYMWLESSIHEILFPDYVLLIQWHMRLARIFIVKSLMSQTWLVDYLNILHLDID